MDIPANPWTVGLPQYFLPVVDTWRGHLNACDVLGVRNSKCWELLFCRKGQIRVGALKVKL